MLFILLCALGHGLADGNLSRVRKFLTYERFKHVSVGEAGVWSVDNNNVVWRRAGLSGSWNFEWKRVEDQRLTQLDVGADVVWGVDTAGQVFVRTGITKDRPDGDRWNSLGGSLTHISVSQEGHVWGVDNGHKIYRRVGASRSNPLGSTWEEIAGLLRQVSVGRVGVWGVNIEDRIWYRTGTYGDLDTSGSGWELLPGALSYIASGETYVIGVNRGNEPYVRLGMSDHSPSGTSWKWLSMKLKMVESFEDQLWGISAESLIWHALYKPQWCTC